MSVLSRFAGKWSHVTAPDSLDRHSRELLLLASVLTASIFALLLWGGQLATGVQFSLGIGLIAGLGLLARWRGLVLLGPVFGHELVRMARRRRYFVLRVGFAT